VLSNLSELYENKFALKLVTSTDDKDYLKALSIYNRTTPIDIKTDSNQITYWLDNKSKSHSFELLVFILYLDNKIIGLAMLCYIPQYKFIIYDYIALDEQYRVNAVFFTYMSLIENYIDYNTYDVSYYIVEISHKNKGNSVDKESKLFKKLIYLDGFGIINAKYLTIPLGLENHESSYEAYIYIKNNDKVNTISKSTFFNIVDAIYYNYYLKWYEPFITLQIEEYKRKIDVCYKFVQENTASEINFHIDYPKFPFIDEVEDEITHGHLPSKKKKKYKTYPLMIAAVILLPLILIWIYNSILEFLKIPISSVNSLIGGMFGAILSAVTTWIITKKKS
jgi:hypothetical protein